MASKEEVDEGGELVFAGSLSFGMTGRSKPSQLHDGVPERLILSFSRLKPFVGVSITKVFCGPLAHHFVAVGAQGKTWIWGRNESGQLGLGDRANRYNPCILPGISDVVSAACSGSHTLVCDAGGSMWGFGNNSCGQLGIGGRMTDFVPSPTTVQYDGTAVQVAVGKDFSCFVESDGSVFSFGCPNHGCLGNGTEGKSLEKAGKFTFANEATPILVEGLGGAEIKSIACGSTHTICADSEGKVYAWGFNGYGQLGIGNNKTQLSPQKVPFFHNVTKEKPANIPSFMWRPQPEMRAKFVTCGAMCCNVIANQDALYFWGIRKVSNEAKLSPQVVDDVSGWTVGAVACGPSATIVGAEYQDDHSLITWGGSPTFGELGYGPKSKFKSSTHAKKVDSLDGSTVLKVAMGYGYSLAIIKRDAKSTPLLEKSEVLDPAEPGPVTYVAKAKGGFKGKRKKSASKKGGKKKVKK